MQADVILRKKEVYDGAVPSGNSIMAENLFYLSIVFDIAAWQAIAEKISTSLGIAIVQYPTSFGVWASLLLKNTFGTNELVVTGNDFENLRNQVLLRYLPGKILQSARCENGDFPMLKDKNSGKETLIYLCRQYSCKTPVNTIEKLITQLKEFD